jgi:hypothetical protein
MSVLVWLTPPVASVLLAIVWTWWRGRPPRPADPKDSVASYERFRSALASAEEHAARR